MLWTPNIFLHYLNTVWVNEHPVPTEPAALATFDMNEVMRDYRSFVSGGGRPPEHGASVQELWLGGQLGHRAPTTCLLNQAQPEQDVSRITRLERLAAQNIWTGLERHYAARVSPDWREHEPLGPKPIQTTVYDGHEIAHVLTAYAIHEDEVHFHDSWPGRSLLCAEHNRAGVKAQVSNLIEHCWRITRAEFERVIFSVFLYDETQIRKLYLELAELTPEERQTAEGHERIRAVVQSLNRNRKHRNRPPDGMRMLSRLHAGALLNHVWRVKVAINEMDRVDERDEEGNTPLHLAARNGHMEVVQLLVRHGADRRIRNSEGKTPGKVARDAGHKRIAAVLSLRGRTGKPGKRKPRAEKLRRREF